MTKFEMKKNELIEKGKVDGYILIQDVVEISKECKVSEEEVLKFQKEIESLNIKLLDKAPAKTKETVKKVKEIKSFEDRKNELVKKGKEKGFITFEEIADALKGLEVDNDSLDDLYNTLMENNIEMQNVSKKYQGFTLKNISFNVPEGSIVGLIGENRSWKNNYYKINTKHYKCRR